VDPRPINEALALVYAELGSKSYTGIGISAGGGMVNVCFAMFGNPLFSFSIVNSGDWIDKMAAKATGESVTYINKEKHKIDLSKAPTTLVERAIQTQYRIMIEHTVTGIKKGLLNTSKSVKTDQAIDFVVAGGTSSPPGFKELFTQCLKEADLSVKIGEVIQPKDPLYSVARGCLLAAEAAT
jgi:Ethanolamine utilization protein EutJ (predicted chaperonin)